MNPTVTPSRAQAQRGAREFELVQGAYRARLARSEADRDAVFALRFETFNLELGEGLAESWLSQRDVDPYDAQCDHLLVELRETGAVIGTYRMQTARAAAQGRGFYCDSEFWLSDLPAEIREGAIELGRACIAPKHRQRSVLYLLWRGLAAYMHSQGTRWFFGCCSLPGNDASVAHAADTWLAQHGHLHPSIRVRARPAHAFEPPRGPVTAAADLPALFRTYLRHGARIASEPASDRAFGTTDFLTLLDVRDLAPRHSATYTEP